MYKMRILFKQDKHMLQYFVSTFYFIFIFCILDHTLKT